MLVVTANWAFTDGTVVTAHRGRAGRAWLRCVRRAAVRAGFGRDGGYRPPDGLDIVFAGDTFDCLTSTAWRGSVRPWRSGARAAATLRDVLLASVRRAAPFLAGLSALARRGLRVPAADRRGRPSVGPTVAIPVRVVFVPGDRDLAVAEAAADIAARGATVAACWTDATAEVAHGHEFDPACQAPPAVPRDDRAPTLAESVITDLVVPFAGAVADVAGRRSPAARLLAAVADAAPLDVAAELAAWSTGGGPWDAPDEAVRCGVAAEWRRAVDCWLRSALREPPDCGLDASPLESLAAWFHHPAGRPTAEVAVLLDRSPPPAATAGRAAVFGHPMPATGDGTRVCLGRAAVRRLHPVSVVRTDAAADAACVVATPSPSMPPTVARVRAVGGVEWSWVTDARPAAPAAAAPVASVVDAA